jgi:CheY-like chemotaxis protein
VGLGLALARSFTELHGGAISVEGVESRGSRFIVTIPMASDAAEAAAIQPPRDNVHGLSRRVLVVDDNADATEMLHAALSNAGHVVRTAATASDALAVAMDLEPEVAILDIGLPDIDGYELARRLRQSQATMRLIALTGYGQTGDVMAARSAGFDAHCAKPVSTAALLELIEECADLPDGRVAPLP